MSKPWRIGASNRSWESYGTHDRSLPCIVWALGDRWSATLDLHVERTGVEVGVTAHDAAHSEGGVFGALPTGKPLHMRLERVGEQLATSINGLAMPEHTLGDHLTGETRLALRLARGASVTVLSLILSDRP